MTYEELRQRILARGCLITEGPNDDAMCFWCGGNTLPPYERFNMFLGGVYHMGGCLYVQLAVPNTLERKEA